MAKHLYIFGERMPQFPNFKYEQFCFLAHLSSADTDCEWLRGQEAKAVAAGREVYTYTGPTVGNECYPAEMAPELADALKRAGRLV